MSALEAAVKLAQVLGRTELDATILAEGNVSARIDEDTFWVKASGFSMTEISQFGFVQVRFEPFVAALSDDAMTDEKVRSLLKAARVDEPEYMPSVETFMHAYLLGLPGVSMVGHTHPTALLSLLCLEGCAEMARQRLFPDEVVCCGPAAAFVPYVDPGLPLARAIKASVELYVAEHGAVPKTIWLANHGLIALGLTEQEVESATRMSVKAARVWLSALSAQRPIQPLALEQIERIHTRPDEHYRQKLLWQVQHT